MRIVGAEFHFSRSFRLSWRKKLAEQVRHILEEIELVTMCSGMDIFCFFAGAAKAIELKLLTHEIYLMRTNQYFLQARISFL